MERRINPFGLITIILGVLVVIGILTFASPCIHDDGTVATCFPASRAVWGAGVACIVLGALSLFFRNPKLHAVLSVLVAVAGLVAVVSPGGLFPLCMMETMRCWIAMRPFALVCGIVAIVIGLIGLRAAIVRMRNVA